MNEINSIAVYCGSNNGRDPAYMEAARALAESMARQNLTLVYGGGNIGLMGVMANTMLVNGGKAIGVIPHKLADLELAHEGLTELHLVETMHQRKAMMAELADAVIALPGGLGTMEELFEAMTWTQLGYHAKPCGLVNTDGYYDALLQFMDHMVKEHFVRHVHRELLRVNHSPVELIEQLKTVDLSQASKWV